MMYNPQQFPMGAQPSHGGFPGAPNMMPGAGPAGMMQNTGMQHMAAANGQSKPRSSLLFTRRRIPFAFAFFCPAAFLAA